MVQGILANTVGFVAFYLSVLQDIIGLKLILIILELLLQLEAYFPWLLWLWKVFLEANSKIKISGVKKVAVLVLHDTSMLLPHWSVDTLRSYAPVRSDTVAVRQAL